MSMTHTHTSAERRESQPARTSAMDNDLVKRLLWAGITAGIAALVGLVANRIAAAVWIRAFNEEPPE